MNYNILGLKFSLSYLEPPAEYFRHPVAFGALLTGLTVIILFFVLGASLLFWCSNLHVSANLKTLIFAICAGFAFCVCAVIWQTIDHWNDETIRVQTESLDALARNKSNKYLIIESNKPVKAIEKNAALDAYIKSGDYADHSKHVYSGIVSLRVKYFDNKQEKFDNDHVVLTQAQSKINKPREVYVRKVKLTKLGQKYATSDVKQAFDNNKFAVVKYYAKTKSINWQTVEK